MILFENAINLIDKGLQLEGLQEISKLYNISTHNNKIDNYILDLCNNSVLNISIFLENSELLKNYPYIFNKDYDNFNNNKIKLIRYNENISFVFDGENFKLYEIETSSKQETKYFFENIDNPILVENEFNEFNLNFLVDNVRASEDVAYENHIYLYYDSIEYFSLLLYYCDLAPLLEKQKVVLLIGEEEKSMYPINFKEKFDIDYNAMEFQELRIDEIKRIVVQLHLASNSGNDLFVQSYDGHPNMLNMGGVGCSLETAFGQYNADMPLNDYLKLVNDAIDNSNVNNLHEFIDGFVMTKLKPFSNNQNGFIKFFRIFEDICKENNANTKKDWMCANYLAFAVYCNFKNTSRISPTIHHVIHWTEGKKAYGFRSIDSYKNLINTFVEFSYFKAYSHIRDPIISLRGYTKNMNWRIRYDNKTNFWEYYNSFSQSAKSINLKKLDVMYSHEFDKKVFIRFEDMKLNPKATLVATCKWLNIPYDDSMEVCTFMGKPIFIEDTAENKLIGKVKSGFSVYPMYPRDMYDNVFSKENIEILEKFLYPTYQYMGYKPLYLDEKQVNENLKDDDFEAMKKNKFLFEKTMYENIDLNEVVEHNKKKVKISELIEIYRENFYKNGIAYKNKTLEQIANNEVNLYPVLKPDERYLVNPIYENLNSLPKLDDITIDFIEKDNPLITEFDWTKHYFDKFQDTTRQLNDTKGSLDWNRKELTKQKDEVSRLKSTLELKEKEILNNVDKIEIFKLQGEVNTLKDIFVSSQDNIVNINNEITKLKDNQKLVNKYKGQVNYHKNDKESIKQSSSYKIGRLITWLPRKIRDILK